MKALLKKDISRKWLVIIIILLFAAKIFLTSQQTMYITPYESPIDDALMFRAAQSITNGNWLGDYGWITMAKHMFFAVWLSFLHALHIPYLIGGQILYAACALCAALCFNPVIKKRYLTALIFAFILFNPVSWAEYTSRVYRDNIFPSLCLLFFAGIIGLILRYREKTAKQLLWAFLGGLGLGLAWLTREDGAWLLPFAVAASLFYIGVIVFTKTNLKEKLAKIFASCVPFAVFGLCLCVFAFLNYVNYGRFVVSDFSSREFADAYGAVTRLHTGAPVFYTDSKHTPIPVTHSEFEEGAKYSPLLKSVLDEFDSNIIYYNGYGNAADKQLFAGGLHWALRLAAQNLGYYETPQTAMQFYTELADQINAACDEGKILGCGKKRSSTLVRFDKSFIKPTAAETFNSAKMLFLFEDTEALQTPLSSTANKEQIAEWEGYLGTKCTEEYYAENSDRLYVPKLKQICLSVLNFTMWLYRIAVWPMLIAALYRFGVEIKKIFTEMHRKALSDNFLFTVMLTGILLSFILRIVMISYVEVASFRIGTYLMYLSSAEPLLLIFCAVLTARFIQGIAEK